MKLSSGSVVLAALIIAGCGSSGTTSPGPDTTVAEDGAVEDTVADVVTPVDVVEATDPTPGDQIAVDVPVDNAIPDIQPDITPPKVTKTAPAADAANVSTPFKVAVSFSEAIRFKETVDKNTFRINDINGKQLEGTYTYDAATFTVTWTPKANVVFLPAAPYTVTLTNIIQDLSGNKLEDWYVFHFATALPAGMDKYEKLAAKYSPVVYQATQKAAPHFDYLTSLDFDGNWTSLDNDKSAKKATSFASHVYYDVIESKSHFFITYAYYYPIHMGVVAGEDAYANDVSGATVVVAKYPEETPIAVELYFGAGQIEEVRAYVSAESGIVKEKDKKYYGVNWVFPQGDLFPNGHYQAYLPASKHESCLWIQTNKESTLQQRCLLNDGIKASMTKIQYVYKDGTAEKLTKKDGVFPDTAAEVGYGLRSILNEWWIRRDRVGADEIYAATYTYEPPEYPVNSGTYRPGTGMEIPGTFLDAIAPTTIYKGRPPWAWKWEPAGSLDWDFWYYEIPRGNLFLDPAYFFMMRHRLTAGFKSDTKEGYSADYCFNPYVLIDQRDKDPDCKAL